MTSLSSYLNPKFSNDIAIQNKHKPTLKGSYMFGLTLAYIFSYFNTQEFRMKTYQET